MPHAAVSAVSRTASRRALARLRAAALTAAALSLGGPLFAASTGTSALFTPQGSDAGTPNGDYITDDSGGLNTFYRYFIEVPPGLSRLTVELFDPDIGEGGGTEDTAGRDRDRDDGYDTQVDYTLIRPDGSTAATLNDCDDNTCNDNAWQTLLNSTSAQNTAAGHWELRVDMGTANDINALGIRAHDGNSGSGGTELNVYYDSHAQFGVNPSGNGNGANEREYTVYPYLTAGCSAAKNDFDFDRNSGDTGEMVLTSRNGTFTQNYDNASTGNATGFSNNNAWRRDTFTGWTSDQLSVGYGLWTGVFSINTYFTPGVNGNYANVYFTNFQAAANPPAANPTANAFRVYLPTDAGGAPVKVYVEQLLTHTGCAVNGPNPPIAGQTSCFTVTVRVVNPEARAITFSAANLVTANVPGGGVVYGGLLLVSQGAIVSQPAVGGTGNITWNPGSVAAGATALLAYTVRVTPTSAGQRLPVTATPASGNGTRARYVDNTGNTTQGRATYQFGPLCELAVTENLLTHAVVSGIRALPAQGGGVLLEWQTASEAGTAGFHVQRWDRTAGGWVPVNRELLGGLLHAPQGGTYRLVDGGVAARAGEELVYRIEEVEAGGRRRVHGPFAVAVDGENPDPRTAGGTYERAPHPAAGRAEAAESAVQAGSAAPAPPVAAGAAGVDGVHLAVRETGLYSLSAAQVADWFGLTVGKAGKMIAEGKLALTRGGQPVAWYPDLLDGGLGARDRIARGLFFYGEAPDSLYTEAAAYRLQPDVRGLLMPAVPAGAGPAAAGGAFTEVRHSERDTFPATLLGLDPESDYWFWEFLQGGDPTFGRHTFPLDASGLAETAGAAAGSLTVALHGATATGVAGEHRATVALNGTPLGETQWTGITPQRATFPITPGLLRDEGNEVEVTAAVGDGAPYSIIYVDSFDLSYPRAFRAAGDVLSFNAGNSPRVTVEGFSTGTVHLLDVRQPLRPRWLTGPAVESAPGAGFRLTFSPGLVAPNGRYLAVAPAALKTPAAVRPWSAPGLRARTNRADYLVLAPAALRDAAERLADLRRAQGLDALVVDLDQVADEFNGGDPGPQGIRALLAAAVRWSRPPRYVVLAGDGTVDYRNLLGHGDNLVPPLLVQSEGGLFSSDNRLGDVNGDGLPEMAVGRLPVHSADELDAYTAKLSAYESAPEAGWAAKALLVADAPDGGADFTADNDRIAGQIPGFYTVERIDLGAAPFAGARARLLGALADGAGFVNYMGHGALDRLSAGGLLTSADVPGLANGERLPVLTAMTCTVNRFALPGIPALGELLVKSPDGGAIAVWGPSGLSSAGGARLLAERFYHAAGGVGGQRLGDLILQAVAEFRNLGGASALPRIYDLLGDPALRLQAPAGVGASPEGTGE